MSAYPRRRVALRRARPLTLDRLEDRCTPAVFTVANTSDAGPGSLRQAILDANALAGADSVLFDPAAFSSANTISLTTGTLTITDSLSVVGTGAGVLTLNAMQKRGLTIDGPGTLAVTISGLTLTNGSTTGDGGGIFIANESVTIDHCTISHSTALGNGGGVWAGVGSNLTLTECDVLDSWAGIDGGGLASRGDLQITGASFLRNASIRAGGGLFVEGPGTTLADITFAFNRANQDGGGLVAEPTNGPVKGYNLTISGNSAGRRGGGLANRTPGFFDCSNLTVTGNTAALDSGGLYLASGTFNSCIVAGNSAPRSPDVSGSTYPIRSAIGKHDSQVPQPLTGGIPPGTDLKLGPLAYNGGPRMTHALLPGSPCIDRAELLGFSDNDGRGPGFSRQVGLFPDIGAYESSSVVDNPPVIRSTGTDYISVFDPTGHNFSVEYTAQQAIDVTSFGNSDIRVSGPNGFSTLAEFVTIVPSSYPQPLVVTYRFTAPGGKWDPSDFGVYSYSMEPNQVFDVSAKAVAAGPFGFASTSFPGVLTVTNPGDDGPGSLRQVVRDASSSLLKGSTITFDSGVFSGSHTISLTSGEISVPHSLTISGPGSGRMSLRGNKLSRLINFSSGNPNVLTLQGMTFSNGLATNGGAIVTSFGKLVVSECQFIDNTATGSGGAIDVIDGFNSQYYNYRGSLDVRDSTFIHNIAQSGGGIAIGKYSQAVLNRCDMIGNTASLHGGGVFTAAASTISACSFTSNVAVTGSGGAVYQGTDANTDIIAKGQIAGSAFIKNTAKAGSGGAAAFTNSYYSKWSVVNCTIADCQAKTGGGLYLAGDVSVQYCTIVRNLATQSGGGLYASASYRSGNLADSIIYQNSSPSGPDVLAPNSPTFQRCALGSVAGYGNTRTQLIDCIPPGVDLRLGSLSMNGGRTPTLELLPGSPCIDHGFYSVTGNDQRGNGFPRLVGRASDIGAYESVSANEPIAIGRSFYDVRTINASAYAITLRYYPLSPLDKSSLDDLDLTVTGPGGFVAHPALRASGTVSYLNGIQVRYEFSPPNGLWTAAANGDYDIRINPNQVFDSSGRAFAAQLIGRFTVNVPNSIIVRNDLESGPGSLREALAMADASAGISDTITFDFDYFASPRTIRLKGEPLVMGSSMTLIGPGMDLLTIDGDNRSGVLDLRPAVGQRSISGLTVTRGRAASGGGISYTGLLTIQKCRIESNTATNGGGLFGVTGSQLTLSESRVTGNRASEYGGGIYSQTLSVTLSTVADNSSVAGGGIASWGNLSFRDSALVRNLAAGGAGGGLYMFPNDNLSVVVTTAVVNSTVSANTAATDGGGLYLPGWSSVSITFSTIVNNQARDGRGGGIARENANPNTTYLDSSIVAQNSSPAFPDIFATTSMSAYACAIGSQEGISLFGSLNLPAGVDLRIGPLSDNGGPTVTHSLLPDSPCINASTFLSSVSTDQRQFNRALSAPDIGAFEVQPVRVSGVIVNDGSVQRSRVTSLTVSFSGAVSLPAVPADAFRLVRQYDGAVVVIQAKLAGNSAVLTFTGGPLEAGSLADGKYTLTVRGSQVLKGLLDGNGDGTPGDDFVLGGNPATNRLYRMFGDSNGDGIVNQTDLLAFRLALFSTSAMFDADGSGQVDLADFLRFRQNLFRSVP